MNKLDLIASQFALEGKVASISPLGEGFINDTFIIRTEGDAPDYILQRKNHHVFPNVPAMMDNIARITAHIKAKVAAAGGDPMREVLTVVPTKDGSLYVKDDEGCFWAVCVFIKDSVTYDRATSLELAFQGGAGIGRFQAQLADFNQPLADTIEGFHNIRVRFEQWDATIAADPVGRVKEVSEEIGWIESRRARIMEFWEKVENGTLPKGVAHNDTKLSNILFDKDGSVLCAIDLDTCMLSTPLNDVGDALRSYTNTGAEDDRNLDNVSMDIEVFKAYVGGYLSERYSTLTPEEVKMLPFSGIYITYEQVLRFLMDYIDGDRYYKTAYEGHNLVRTHAQYRLLQSMEAQYEAMQDAVAEIVSKL